MARPSISSRLPPQIVALRSPLPCQGSRATPTVCNAPRPLRGRGRQLVPFSSRREASPHFTILRPRLALGSIEPLIPEAGDGGLYLSCFCNSNSAGCSLGPAALIARPKCSRDATLLV